MTTMPNPQPIPFPSRPAAEQRLRTPRANLDNERWQRQVEQRQAIISAAAQDGYARGERKGYTQGWHWGVVCGTAAGGMAVGVLWAAWDPVQRLLAAWGLA